MGVQSLDEALLDRLGRVHSREMVFKSFDTLRQAGFDNVNVDLMFAIPGQTMDVWRATLDEAIALGSEHLSSYEVIYEEDTPLFAQMNAGEFDVDEELACDMFEELVQRSATAGFRQYEIANFARDARVGQPAPTSPQVDPLLPTLACQHNVNYWRGGDFHGLGPSATGYVRGVRTKNWANTQLFCEQLEKGKRAIESREEFPPLKRAGETAAFGLRMNAGWPFAEFQRVTGLDLRQDWSTDMDSLVQKGWAVRSPDRFQLTPQGLRFADTAAELFLR
jgi:oxygen-independent coproporphyrinogen-3 oxidase